jgi:hypothetical protein
MQAPGEDIARIEDQIEALGEQIARCAKISLAARMLGSNATTWKQTEAALRASQTMRDELIGQLDMRVVEERRTLH